MNKVMQTFDFLRHRQPLDRASRIPQDLLQGEVKPCFPSAKYIEVIQVCCHDRNCPGCTTCRNKCVNGPVRGNYDGLVVLTAVTRDSLPNQPIVVSKRTAISK